MQTGTAIWRKANVRSIAARRRAARGLADPDNPQGRTDQMARILIVTPAAKTRNSDNRVTAERYAGHFCALGHLVTLAEKVDSHAADLLNPPPRKPDAATPGIKLPISHRAVPLDLSTSGTAHASAKT
jgi:hypothetical protein